MIRSRNIAEYRKRASRASFTLIETVIALAIMAFLIIEVSAVQGNSIVFSDYSRNVTQATWLAKRVLSQVEYYWNTKPFTDIDTKQSNVPLEGFEEYNYSLEIKEWKFPFEKLLTGGLGGGGDDESEEEDPLSAMIETVIKQVFGDEPQFMTAFVDVCWAEGATQNCSSMTYLLTNQKKLDAAVIQLKPVYDKMNKPEPKPRPGSRPRPNTSGGGGSPAGGGGDG